ncbi:MAG TPA: hypothetical protein VF332_08360 [Vicinamibacterales bacterium]
MSIDYYICEIQVPESGVFNFTTVDVGPFSIRFRPNSRNTPVIVLATGDMTLSGAIDVSPSSNGRTPGPGGFYGGNGQYRNGFGPGGGTADAHNGRWVGSLSLVPITGGSGGAGFVDINGSYEGGGGGGAIVFAASGAITVSGTIRADGALGTYGADGHGSGGAIRIVANQITVTETGTLFAQGGRGAPGANPGVVRLEAPVLSMSFKGHSTPAVLISDINPNVQPAATTPALTIVSMGGFPVTRYAGSIPDSVDLLLPAALPDPIALVVNAANIPVGTTVHVTATGSPMTSTGGVLEGTLDSSSTTLQISGLVRTTQSHLFVYATFDVTGGGGAGNPPGPDQVASVRLESPLGGPSRFQFLRTDGSVVPAEKLRPEFLARFNQ